MVFAASAFTPVAVLPAPVVSKARAPVPIAVLSAPVDNAARALVPAAKFLAASLSAGPPFAVNAFAEGAMAAAGAAACWITSVLLDTAARGLAPFSVGIAARGMAEATVAIEGAAASGAATAAAFGAMPIATVAVPPAPSATARLY